MGASNGLLNALASLGSFASFAWVTVRNIPATLRLYPAEVLRQLKDIAWGSGALVVGGGTVGVMVLLSLSAGTSLGIEGFNGLELVGLAPLTGFISASANTRELAPLIAALALASQVGCRFTAQLGSMKIHEEVDALEVMAVSPMRYLVTTRTIACMVAILPLYLVGLLGSYVASMLSVVRDLRPVARAVRPLLLDVHPGPRRRPVDGQDRHLRVRDHAAALLVRLQGAAAGPQSVGEATGAAIRASIVVVVLLDMVLTLVFWGGDSGFRVSG